MNCLVPVPIAWTFCESREVDMKNYKLTIAYDGSRFHGWEKKPGQDTVQGRIENVLGRMCPNQGITLIGAGRTDAGVHAKGMVASVMFESAMSDLEIRDY